MSAKLDRRLTAATDRVALSRLKGVIERPEYTDGTPSRIGGRAFSPRLWGLPSP